MILGHPPKVGAEPHLGLFFAVGGACHCLADGGAQTVAGFFEQRQVQILLAVEVLVEHRLGDTGGIGHVVHRRRMEAVAGEDLHRDIEDLLTAGGCRQAHAHVVDLIGLPEGNNLFGS